MSLVFDARLCTGCQACQMACLDQRDIRPLEGQVPLLRVEPAKEPGRLLRLLLSYVEQDEQEHAGCNSYPDPSGPPDPL